MKATQILQPASFSMLLLCGALLAGTASCGHKSARAGEDSINRATAANESPAPEAAAPSSAPVTIQKRWTMPSDLLEISGISWMDDQRIACVQDERGSLYIYNLATSRVEKEIPFAGPGDYESVSKAGAHFFVMRADGHLYELDPAASKPVVKEWDAIWPGKHDIEAMSYDAAGKRLLIVDKMGGGSPRGVYAFDLASGRMSDAPVMEIVMDEARATSADEGSGGKKKGGKKGGGKKGEKKGGIRLQPSAMATNPQTGEIYIADGPGVRLLVLDHGGKTTRVIPLNKADFPQPEGLTVSPKGEVFLSSEGVKGDGVIARISL